MNATVIHRMALASLSGTLPFPEIVGTLIAEGVEYYHVDYVTRQFAFYGADGEVVTAPLVIENLPPIAPTLNVETLKAAIVDSQQHGQKFPRFSARAMESGVNKILGHSEFPGTRQIGSTHPSSLVSSVVILLPPARSQNARALAAYHRRT